MPLPRVAVTGAGGLVGSALMEGLRGEAETLRLVRSGPSGGERVRWDPADGSIDAARLDRLDAVVHLAGESIAAGRWSAARKERIRASRVEGTRLLASALAGLARPPRALVCASAIGYYGDRGDEPLDESASRGSGFLADVVASWEAEALKARAAGIRVACLRFGIVLSPRGGALARMLPPFKLGAGGRLGSGRQWMSWIHIADVVAVIRLALEREGFSGPVNVVSPEPARNADFTRALGRALGRPAVLPAPAFALRLALGEMAQALLLSSQKVVPGLLRQAGYSHLFPRLDGALADLLAR
ncbi:MAG TPA: TIGR01777 family oxidoreductase [Candidatus Polarisedimenticolia bacterium]|nr:TIGR01777 family oxidoreductase [Candidatus Polarisedimenticolia bacterium]